MIDLYTGRYVYTVSLARLAVSFGGAWLSFFFAELLWEMEGFHHGDFQLKF